MKRIDYLLGKLEHLMWQGGEFNPHRLEQRLNYRRTDHMISVLVRAARRGDERAARILTTLRRVNS